MTKPIVDNNTIKLVDYDLDFLDLSWKWLNDKEIKILTMTPDFTKEQQMDFFYSLNKRTDYIIYGITYMDKKIGVCGLKNIDKQFAEYWGYIGEKEYWGMGIGKKILSLMIEEAILKNLRVIYLKVYVKNIRAINLYEKFDFSIKETFEDYLIMEKNI